MSSVFFVAVIAVTLAILLGWLRILLTGRYTHGLRAGGRALIVTAHPDDECMFFSPTILATGGLKCHTFLLCLSEGNYYGQGSLRRQELLNSAEVLGVPASQVQLIDDRQLPDNPDVEWNKDVIGQYVLASVKKNTINRVITFDDRGVSGHPNHIAVSKAVRRLHQQGALRQAGVTELLLLETSSTFQKYTSWLGALWSASFSRCYVLSSFSGYLQARKAMRAHWSQYLWFRRLYVAFSQYMIVNTLQKL